MQMGFLVFPAGLALQLLAMLVLARHFGPERFGVFAVIFTIAQVANLVAEMGLGTIVIKLVAEAKKPAGYYIGLALPFIWVAATICAAVQIGIVLIAYSSASARWAGLFASANILLYGNLVVLNAALRGLGEIEKWMIGFLGQKVLVTVLVFVLVRPLDGDLPLGMAVWTMANFATLLYYLICLRGSVRRGRLYWDWPAIKALVAESIPVGLISAVHQLASSVDVFILAVLGTPVDVGIYNVGQRLINPARNVLHGAVSSPTFPVLCRLVEEDRSEFARRSSRICLIQWFSGLTLAVVAWIASPHLIPIILDSGFGDSIYVIQITAWAIPATCFSLQMRYVYIALSRQRAFLKMSIVYLVFKVLVVVVLTWQHGIWGACFGTVLCELVFALATRVGVAYADVRMDFGWGIVWPTVATGLLVLACRQLGGGWFALLLVAMYLPVAAMFLNRLLGSVRGGGGSATAQNSSANTNAPAP